MSDVEPVRRPIAVTRAAVLNYRIAVHHLEHPADDPLRDGVLVAGVQDYPPGRTAGLALRVRGATVDPARVAVVHSLRATSHLHRAADLACLAVALRPLEVRDLATEQFGAFGRDLTNQHIGFTAAVDQVAEAMQAVTADERPRTKGELSTALSELVDARLRPSCPGCAAHHVQDTLFRYATLQAGLCIAVPATGPFHYLPWPVHQSRPDPQRSQRALVRQFLQLCGPARPEHLAKWLALTPAAAQRLWQPLGDQISPVTVEGQRRWIHREDLDELRTAPAASQVRLLPPYDPLTEFADRELVLPDRAHRRAVWRATANPGVLLVRGEIAGIWRQHTGTRRLTVTIRPFNPLAAALRRAARREAEALYQPDSLAVDTEFAA